MNRVIIDLNVLRHNIERTNELMIGHEASWTLVTKVLCGHAETIRALQSLGVRSIADARLANLKAIERWISDFEAWYLRLPHTTAISEIVSLADVSLNSEIRTFDALNTEAKRQNKIHRIIVMIELGDLREGILPGTLVEHYKHAFSLSNIEVVGIGANLGCVSGAVPNIDQFTQLLLYRELLELKFEHKLPLISAGTSSVLPLLIQGQLPSGINHFRIGEAVFLGTDLVNGGTLPGYRDDGIHVEAEVVEVKNKNLVPLGETTDMTPFEAFHESDGAPGMRGYRAIVTLGQLDTEVQSLTPCNPDHQIAGASSDLTVVNIGGNPGGLGVGDKIAFRPNYGALLRLMNSPYIDKIVEPTLSSFREEQDESTETYSVPKTIDMDEQSDRGEVPRVKHNSA